MLALLLLACSGAPDAPAEPEAAPPEAASAPDAPRSGDAPPPLPPPGGAPGGPQGPALSGAALQDPFGFPTFHDQPAPPGPPVEGAALAEATALTGAPAGGYRPQIAAGPDGSLSVVYYDRTDAGDIIRYVRSEDGGGSWSSPQTISFEEGRNWGPDLVVRGDGSVVVVFDKAGEDGDFRSRGWMTIRSPSGAWSAPTPLTQDGDYEIGSGHVAHGPGGDLAYIYIGKSLGPEHHFQAWWAWGTPEGDGLRWSEHRPLSDGSEDAWHTNVERRPDGSVLGGFDVGTGGAETELFVVDGRGGAMGAPESLTATSGPGERPHFAFGADGTDHVTWFHKDRMARPLKVFVRSGAPGAWDQPDEVSAGLGGFHFDPDVAINGDGVRALVWGWDQGSDAELLYSLDRGDGWSAPRKLAEVDRGKPGLPSIDVDPEGRFHVVWNQGVRGENDVYHAVIAP